jgi:transposase
MGLLRRSTIASLGGCAAAYGEPDPGAHRQRSSMDRDDRLHARQSASLGGGRKRGEQKQAIGRSRGGRNTKIHALADAKGRLIAILLTGGEAHHHCPVAERLIRRVKSPKRMLATRPMIAPNCAKNWMNAEPSRPFQTAAIASDRTASQSASMLRGRTRVPSTGSRTSGRIATRYDRLARNFLASVCLAAALVWWI